VGVAVTRPLFARGAVHLVTLDPTQGSEIRKTRPCLIVSPDELNQHLRTVVVAPMTTAGRAYPWRVPCRFQRRSGFVAVDQLRTVDTERLVKRLGKLDPETVTAVLEVLQEMFAE
jgi:mRNA interferase MazF